MKKTIKQLEWEISSNEDRIDVTEKMRDELRSSNDILTKHVNNIESELERTKKWYEDEKKNCMVVLAELNALREIQGLKPKTCEVSRGYNLGLPSL